MHTYNPHRINFKKPGVRQPVAGARLVYKILALCKQLVNISQATLVMYIHFISSSQDPTEVDTTYHQLLGAIYY